MDCSILGMVMHIILIFRRISADFHCILQDELAPQGIGSELIHLGLNQHHQGDNSTTSFTLSFCFADNTRLLYSSAKKVFFDCEGTTLIDTILDAIYHPNPPIDPASLTKLLSTQLSSSELRSRTTSHIEAQIAAARISNDSDRLVAWLAAYAQRLALEENVYKAQELASELPSLGMRMGLDQEKVQQMIASFLTTSSSVMIRCIADQLSTTSNVGGVNK